MLKYKSIDSDRDGDTVAQGAGGEAAAHGGAGRPERKTDRRTDGRTAEETHTSTRARSHQSISRKNVKLDLIKLLLLLLRTARLLPRQTLALGQGGRAHLPVGYAR